MLHGFLLLPTKVTIAQTFKSSLEQIVPGEDVIVQGLP